MTHVMSFGLLAADEPSTATNSVTPTPTPTPAPFSDAQISITAERIAFTDNGFVVRFGLKHLDQILKKMEVADRDNIRLSLLKVMSLDPLAANSVGFDLRKSAGEYLGKTKLLERSGDEVVALLRRSETEPSEAACVEFSKAAKKNPPSQLLDVLKELKKYSVLYQIALNAADKDLIRYLVDIAITSGLYELVYGLNSEEAAAETVKHYKLKVLPTEAPTELQATLTTYKTIQLSWKDNSLNEEGFIIERAVGEQKITPVEPAPVTPAEPQTPAEPETPAAPATPARETPTTPETPATPEVPAPETPVTPTPETPATPETPVVPPVTVPEFTPKEFKEVTRVPSNQIFYSDEVTVGNAVYFYKVKAFNSNKEIKDVTPVSISVPAFPDPLPDPLPTPPPLPSSPPSTPGFLDLTRLLRLEVDGQAHRDISETLVSILRNNAAPLNVVLEIGKMIEAQFTRELFDKSSLGTSLGLDLISAIKWRADYEALNMAYPEAQRRDNARKLNLNRTTLEKNLTGDLEPVKPTPTPTPAP